MYYISFFSSTKPLELVGLCFLIFKQSLDVSTPHLAKAVLGLTLSVRGFLKTRDKF